MSRRIKVAQDMWQLMGIKREDKAQRAQALMENFRFWGAPVGIIVTVDRAWEQHLEMISWPMVFPPRRRRQKRLGSYWDVAAEHLAAGGATWLGDRDA